MLAVDRSGAIVDGDELIALAAIHLQRRNRLPGQGVAVTVMTNYGFHTAMAAAGIHVATTPVGDRYVLDELRRRGWALGGEQSGHIIDLGFAPSGDGIASALLTLEALGTGDLHERGAMQKLPQRLENVRAEDRASLDAAMSQCLGAVGDRARGRCAERPGPGAGAGIRDRAADQGDGRGSQQRGDRRGLREARGGCSPGDRAG